jgi:hypothetical protein
MPRILIGTLCGLLLLGLVATGTAIVARAGPSAVPAIQIVAPAGDRTLVTDDLALRFAVKNFTVDASDLSIDRWNMVGSIGGRSEATEGRKALADLSHSVACRSNFGHRYSPPPSRTSWRGLVDACR